MATPYERQRQTIHEQADKIATLQRKLESCRQLNDWLFNQNRELSEYIKEMEKINGTAQKDTG